MSLLTNSNIIYPIINLEENTLKYEEYCEVNRIGTILGVLLNFSLTLLYEFAIIKLFRKKDHKIQKILNN
jgi:hypothetical protein